VKIESKTRFSTVCSPVSAAEPEDRPKSRGPAYFSVALPPPYEPATKFAP
jgi:hypothetical protein